MIKYNKTHSVVLSYYQVVLCKNITFFLITLMLSGTLPKICKKDTTDTMH